MAIAPVHRTAKIVALLAAADDAAIGQHARL